AVMSSGVVRGSTIFISGGVVIAMRWHEMARHARALVGRGRHLTGKGGIMRHDTMIRSATLGIVLCGTLAPPVFGASKQVDQITCEEFLAMNPNDQQRIAYWVDGYQTAKGEAAVGVVAFDKFGQPIGALVDDCKATPKETLWQKLKKHL